MNKILLLLVITSSLSISAKAQRGTYDFLLGVEAAFPTGDFNSYKTGVGGWVQGLLGVGESAQVSFTTGYNTFTLKNPPANEKIKTSIIPLLIGYKYNWSIFYAHPQAGLGLYRFKTKADNGGTSTTTKSSDSGFTLGLGAGVKVSRLDLGLRYQAGFPGGGTISYLGITAGYSLVKR
jgi:hypothetical protein